MVKKLFFIFLLFVLKISAQTPYLELTGNPVNTSGWTITGDTFINSDEIQLTQEINDLTGSIYFNQPFDLNLCNEWRVEFDMKMDGLGSQLLGHGDGIAFWYLDNPPKGFVIGSGLGIPSNGRGLMVGFDTYNNNGGGLQSKAEIMYGADYYEFKNRIYNPKLTIFDLLTSNINLVQPNYHHVTISWKNKKITLTVDNTLIADFTPTPYDDVENIQNGYFGFSASTGGAFDNQFIKNVALFLNTIPIKKKLNEITLCSDENGNSIVDLKNFENDIVDNSKLYHFDYYNDEDNQIINDASNYQFNSTRRIAVDISNGVDCPNRAYIDLNLNQITLSDIDEVVCDTDYDDIFSIDFTSLKNQLNNDNSIIYEFSDKPDFSNIVTSSYILKNNTATLYVRARKDFNGTFCNVSKVLNFHKGPQIDISAKDFFISNCNDNPIFDLTQNEKLITSLSNSTFSYYRNMEDLFADNAINDPESFKVNDALGKIYVLVKNTNFCPKLVTLPYEVYKTPEVNLPDQQYICLGETITLNDPLADPNNDYSWTFDNKMQQGLPIDITKPGKYILKIVTLKNCVVEKTVNIIEREEPTIVNVFVNNNSVNVSAKPSEQNGNLDYSIDGINWQASNQFDNLIAPHSYTVYVREAGCKIVSQFIELVFVPNFITPNGDGNNDEWIIPGFPFDAGITITIFDRFGKIVLNEQIDKKEIWDGKLNSRVLNTANYFYKIIVPETSKTKAIEYTGFLMLKNY